MSQARGSQRVIQMQPFKISVKFFVDDPSGIDAHLFVPVFHSWIQQHAVAEHMLIDVADYEHVHNGPGTVLIAHEANFYLDKLDGFLGFTYSRKQPAPGYPHEQPRPRAKPPKLPGEGRPDEYQNVPRRKPGRGNG